MGAVACPQKGHMMDGSDHSRHALARQGPEVGGQGPQGRLEVCPIELDTVQLNWTWFFSRRAVPYLSLIHI